MKYDLCYKIMEHGNEIIQVYSIETPWYKNEILHSIFGGFIGFVFAYILWQFTKYRENKKLKSDFLYLIRNEIETNLEILNRAFSEEEAFETSGADIKRLLIIQMTKKCFDKLYDKFPILDSALMKDVYKYYSVTNTTVNYTNELDEKYLSGFDGVLSLKVKDVYLSIYKLTISYKEFYELEKLIPSYIKEKYTERLKNGA